MHRFFRIFTILLFSKTYLFSQVLPKEGRKLHYRIINFSAEKIAGADTYEFAIAKGYFNSPDSFVDNILISRSSKEPNMIAEVPSFNSSYTWRVTVTANNKTEESKLYHFSTGTIQDVDTTMVRLRIIDSAVKYKDGYVFLDGNKALYDIQGRAVWYLPDIFGRQRINLPLVDLKMSPQGTITFILNNKAYEISYDGEILWKAPDNGTVSGDTSEHYHHEFTRLANGNYMILGSQSVMWRHDASYDTQQDSMLPPAALARLKKDSSILKTYFGTVIEYNAKGDVVWSWSSANYFMNSDVIHFKSELSRRIVDVHQNSFYFDEQHKTIYVGFKNISRILKVSYPGGKVIASYGEVFKKGVPSKNNGLFCSQHAVRYSHDGYLYLFNNNNCGNDSLMPTVVMMQEPRTPKEQLKKVWEFTTDTKGIENSPLLKNRESLLEKAKEMNPEMFARMKKRPKYTSGGNVVELPDNLFFVSMNNEYSKLYIINRDKQVLWSAIAEKWIPQQNYWEIIRQYRSSMVNNRAELEKMILYAPQKQ